MNRGLLLDLEGVLYEGGHAVAGAVAALTELERRGLQIRYLTNTTTRPRRAIAKRLAGMGFKVDAAHVFSPPAAARLLLASMSATRIHLAAAPGLSEDFPDIEVVGEDDETVDAIVLGDLYKDFTWQRLNGLFQMMSAGVPLIALHRNRVCQREEGLSLDLGPFVAALDYATGVESPVVGKPSAAFFNLALDSLGLAAAEVLMVGDDIEADVGGAQAAGLRAVQVKTGKYRPRDDDHASITPDGRIGSIAGLPLWLEDRGGNG
jgi:HAD superfamily hydrolase (TIGR01458 family)